MGFVVPTNINFWLPDKLSQLMEYLLKKDKNRQSVTNFVKYFFAKYVTQLRGQKITNILQTF